MATERTFYRTEAGDPPTAARRAAVRPLSRFAYEPLIAIRRHSAMQEHDNNIAARERLRFTTNLQLRRLCFLCRAMKRERIGTVTLPRKIANRMDRFRDIEAIRLHMNWASLKIMGWLRSGGHSAQASLSSQRPWNSRRADHTEALAVLASDLQKRNLFAMLASFLLAYT
jgi:hypothetical protein